MSAADEIAKLEARTVSLQQQIDEATRVIGQLSIVLGEHGKLLRQIDARLRAIDGGGPEPTPAPPPLPGQRSAADVTAIIQAEFAATTAYRLNASQLAAWIRYFSDPAMAALAADPFRTAVRAMVEKDIAQYKWPGIDNGPVVISGESS